MSTEKLIKSLQNPVIYDHPIEKFEVIETHSAWVLLTGPYAYKIKKPVNFGFLDFSTLEKRLHYCKEELRLNQRLAPELYIGLITITGRENTPQLNHGSNVIEYAVKMVQFRQEDQLDQVLTRQGGLPIHYIGKLAKQLAGFHQSIPGTDTKTSFGSPELVKQPVKENFEQIRPLLTSQQDLSLLKTLESWSSKQFKKQVTHIKNRKINGHIRECHGDMHLANIALINDEIVFFDCLEFNANLRWIDTISETAFLFMDFDDRKQSRLANCLINTYLEACGDYQGLTLFRFYLVYRAIVRAKVATLRAAQTTATPNERIAAQSQCREYLALARQYTVNNPTPIIITYGLSGSGKSTLSQLLLENYRAIRIRSDVERKRLFKHDLYSSSTSQKTYKHLEKQTRTIIDSGFPAIIDAAFLKQSQREQFYLLAKQLKVPFIILHTNAPTKQLEQWIESRSKDPDNVSDADHSVLKQQITSIEPLNEQEKPHTVTVHTEHPIKIRQVIRAINMFSGKN
ncbi:MAG TPA: aminoglycoside phosphotransferase [Gammaproteobacteria bacterium]|nr:aminoglycoside phosphotransferase [Gammaproteobacteria bacterium]